MGASTPWVLLIGVVLVGSVWCLPLSHPIPAYDARLSSLELAIIKCIVETVPGVTKGGGRAFDWSVVQSRSKELEGAEVEVVQVGQREPDFTGRSGGGYPGDWNIVRSVSSQLAARENGHADGGEGLSDDWGIVKSISTELHLDVEEVPGDGAIEVAYQPPVRPAGRGNIQGSDMVMFPGSHPISSGEDTSGVVRHLPIDVRSTSIGLPGENGMEIQQADMREYHGEENVDTGTDVNQQHQFGNDGSTRQTSGEQNHGGGAIGWSIVRSISSELEPISEEIGSHVNEQSSLSSETQEVKGDTDSYNVVQPIATELQPADSEAGEVPASLTEILPPAEDQTGDTWNSPPSNGVQPSEIDSSETDQSASAESQEPCEVGHKRIKNVCKKVYTFQLKSHIG